MKHLLVFWLCISAIIPLTAMDNAHQHQFLTKPTEENFIEFITAYSTAKEAWQQITKITKANNISLKIHKRDFIRTFNNVRFLKLIKNNSTVESD